MSVQGPGISGEFIEVVETSSCGLCDSSVLVRGVRSLRQGPASSKAEFEVPELSLDRKMCKGLSLFLKGSVSLSG